LKNLVDIEKCENTNDMFYNSSMNEFERKVILSKIDEIDFNNQDDRLLKLVSNHLTNTKILIEIGWWLGRWEYRIKATGYHPRDLNKEILIELLELFE